jgi:glutamate racemase
VLGCTHYAFVHHLIERAMGSQVAIIDTAEAVARHAAHRLRGLVQPGDAPARLLTTGDPQRLRRIADAWLPFACHVEGL